jgi:signal transduction histidine kinase
VDVEIDGVPGRLLAEYLPGRAVDVRGLEGSWLRDADGRLVMAAPCGAEVNAPGPGLGGSRLQGSQPLDPGDTEAGTLAFARGSASAWTFSAAGVNVLRGPLGRLFRNYWVFVLGLGATAVLAFSLLLRRVTGSMADLTDAAERVAAGDLSPWLPAPRDDEVGQLTSAFARMTDRLRELVDQVDRTGRLAILGQLSAYLAHEIRNPLSAVKMNLQRLQRWQRAGEIPDRCAGAIQVSLREVDRLSAAVSNILQLTPGDPREKEIVRVHDLVSEAARLLDSEFTKRGVGLRWELNARADRVLGDPGQLKGVIINLMLNALEAQPDGGKLLIVSELRPGMEELVGPMVQLHFIDSGHGIPAGIAGRVFDPFFSTKEQGSGIGLAVARQTIRDHGGDIRLAEARTFEQGAEVVVQLPLAAVSPENRDAKTEPRVPVWGEGGGVAG